MIKKSLPLVISSFEKIRKDNYIYVDKTEYAYKLFKRGGYTHVFLSRPRRFGKSLFLDTLKQMFLGKRELFNDLWIYNSDYDWQEYPIIHIDFSNFNKNSAKDLEIHLAQFLTEYASNRNIDLSAYTSIHGKFSLLIQKLSKLNNVVILIDEYDKPILDNVNDIKKAEEIRDLLKSFYEVIKGNDSCIRAMFMTGVTKVSQMSIFSGLNNLVDISLDDEYSTILGYTQQEMEDNFSNYFEKSKTLMHMNQEALLTEIKKWYNGYRFSRSEDRVYNPFSILNFFAKNNFLNYWFTTGTPSFLIKLLKAQLDQFQESKEYTYDLDALGGFELDGLPIIPVLYQSGYLTITDYNPRIRQYKLGYPNFEIGESFTKVIL